MTHIVPCDAHAVRTGQFRARCGLLVDGSEHAASPTCAECRRLDEEDESALMALRQMPASEPPRIRQSFDPCAGYRRRTR